MSQNFLTLDEIVRSRARRLLCYPLCSRSRKILEELSNFGVLGLRFRGPTQVEGYNVLGKGHSAIVIEALLSNGRAAAVKLRRSDYSGKTLDIEAKLQSLANALGIGVPVYAYTDDIIVMALVDGLKLYDFISAAPPLDIKRALSSLMIQCYKMDLEGLSHYQLSNPNKHVIINAELVPYILDFGKATLGGKKSNVTAITQALFISGRIRGTIEQKLGSLMGSKILEALKEYKSKKDSVSFNRLLSSMNLAQGLDAGTPIIHKS
jgi:predicted Ser/Thr protein kinase